MPPLRESRIANRESTGPSRPRLALDVDAIVAGYTAGRGLDVLAREHATTAQTIRSRLVERGVAIRPANPAGPRLALDVDAIARDYRAGVGLKRLAEIYPASTATIRNRLAAAGVAIRAQGDRSTRLPDDELAAAYRNGATLADLARRQDVSEGTIANHLRAIGVEPRPNGGDLFEHLDWPRVEREYRLGASTETLAARYDVSPQTVTRRLRAAGVALRPQGSKPNGSPGSRLELPVRELVRLYDFGWSLRDLAVKYDCSEPTVRARLVEAGTTIRPTGRRSPRRA